MTLRNYLVLATSLVILSRQSTGDTNQADSKPIGIRGV